MALNFILNCACLSIRSSEEEQFTRRRGEEGTAVFSNSDTRFWKLYIVNAFNYVWGSNYNENRGILLIKEKSFCLLNDGISTRIPITTSKANPLDLTWTSRNLRERTEWQAEMETLNFDHLVLSIKVELVMNSEAISIKPEIEMDPKFGR